jgi:hypothetical protein
VRVVQRGGEANLSQKPRGDQRLDELRPEGLDGDHPPLRHVAREIDDRRPPVPELSLNLVASGKGIPNDGVRTQVHAGRPWGREVRRL